MIAYPSIDPIIFSIGPFALRWYGLSYVAGFLLFIYLAKRLAQQQRYPLSVEEVDQVSITLILGVVIGGRLGEIIFYHPNFYFSHPLEMLKIWQGGMSFHGGMLGAIIAMMFYARQLKVSPWVIFDAVAPLVPPGLFFGRIANFINAELIGRPTQVPWAMIFPHSDGIPRHPSQLYEAVLEGLVLFGVLYFYAIRPLQPTAAPQKSLTPARVIRGARPLRSVSGMFLLGYGVARFVVEFTRTPDTFMGFYPLGLSMGQFLCLPMIAFGGYLMIRASRSNL